MFVSWWALNTDGSYRAPLPDFTGWALSPVVHSPGAAYLEYPAVGRAFDVLRENTTNERDIEVAAWVDGSAASARHIILNTSDGDDIAEGAIWRFAGNFLLVLLEEALVWPRTTVVQPPTGPAPTTDLAAFRVYSASAGQIIATLAQEAQVRGALAGLTWTFTNTVDSFGVAWSKRTTLKIAPGTTVLKVAQQLAEAGMCEFDLVRQNGALRLLMWEPGTRSVDRTLGSNPLILRRGRDLTDSPRKHTTRTAGTALLAVGGEGLYDDLEDPTARARRGRRIERAASQGSITDPGTLLAYLQGRLPTVTAGQMEVGHGIAVVPGGRRPLVDYDIPDWVWSDTGRGLERLRLGQLTLKGDENGLVAAGASLNDLIADQLQQLSERVDDIEGGGTVTGTSSTAPGEEPPPDTVPPAAPTGLVAESIAYQDPDHTQTLAAVTLAWAEVTTNAAGPTTAMAQAAQAILTRMQSGQSIAEDWTWPGAPQIVGDFNDALQDLFAASGSSDAPAWLASYVADHSQSETATDDVAGYRVRYAYLGLSQVGGIPSSNPGETLLNYVEATPPGGTSDTQITFAGVEAGARIGMQVQAFDQDSNHSAWSAVLEHDTAVDDTPPPVPSAATVSAYLGQLKYGWDGLGAEGEEMPRDLDRVEALGSPENNFGAAVLLDSFSTVAGERVATDLPYDVEFFIWLVAVDRSGNRSGPSAVASAVPAAIGYGDIAFSQVGSLVEDGSFETLSGRERHTERSHPAWAFTDGAAPAAAHGTWSALGTATTGAGVRPLVLSGRLPAVEGQQFVFRLALRRTAATNGPLLVRCTFHLANGTRTTLQVTYTTAEPADTWIDKTPSYYACPAGTVAVELSVALAAECTAGAWLVDRVECREAIGTLLIQNAAITNAKVVSLNVGKLEAGTLTVAVTNAGIIRSGTTGQRYELDASALKFYNAAGAQTIGLDGVTNFIAGTLQSALTGERWVMMPDGTLRLYPASGTNYSQIANFGNDVVWRGPLGANNRSGRVNVNALGVGLNFSAESEIPNSLRSEVVVLDRIVSQTAPFISLNIDQRTTAPDGGVRRIVFQAVSGTPAVGVLSSKIEYKLDSSGNPGFVAIGRDAGWKAEDAKMLVVSASMQQFRDLVANNIQPSSETLKEQIRDLRAVLDPAALTSQIRMRAYKLRADVAEEQTTGREAPIRMGPLAEELPAVLQREIPRPDGGRTIGVDQGSMQALMWMTLWQLQHASTVSTSGRVVVASLPTPGILAAGATIERPVTWDSAPPSTPTGGFAMLQAGVAWAGRVTAWIKTGSVSATGCTVVIKNVSTGPVVPTAGSPITVEAVGLGTYIPPYEEAA